MASTFDPRVLWGDTIPASAPVDGANERCIEVPLALEVINLQRQGRVLDAGCALNGFLSDALAPQVTHLTQNIASETIYAHQSKPLSYVSADLRDLSLYAGAAFDRVACVSTLEHIGMDNSTYMGTAEACPDTMLRAVKELLRVTRSELFISVPYHDPAMHCPQWRFFDKRIVGHLVFLATNFGFQTAIRYYAKCDGGWYGGATQPVDASPVGFPDSVNAIACLRCTS